MNDISSDALLEFAGRLHILVLHLPLGLVATMIVLELVAWLGRRPLPGLVRVTCALLLAAGAVASVATGLLLADLGDDAAPQVLRHRNFGIAAAGLCLAVAVAGCVAAAGRGRRLYAVALPAAALLLALAGHFGGELTHGPGFVFEPLRRAAAPPAAPQRDGVSPVVAAADPAAQAQALLDTYCLDCHGTVRPKAGLTLAGFAVAAAPADGVAAAQPDRRAADALLARLRLPMDHDDRMPPAHKPQPTPGEIGALEAWAATLAEPAAGDSGGQAGATGRVERAAQPAASSGPEPLSAEAEATASALLAAGAHLEVNDPADGLLWIDASRATRADPRELLGLLAPLAERIGELSLAGVALDDASAAALPSLPALRRLDLSATRIGSATLAALAASPQLEALVLHRTPLDAPCVEVLASMPALRRLVVSGAGLGPEAVAMLRARLPECAIVADEPLTVVPTAVDDPRGGSAALRPVNDRCPVTGAAVDPRFVVIHEGRAVGLCCPGCAEQLWTRGAAPAK